MKLKPPLLLVVVLCAYLAYLLWLTVTQFSPVVGGRLAISALLVFFVLRGSRTAGTILAVLCGISGLILVVAAIATFNSNPTESVVFCIVAGLTFTFSSYLLFSKAVRQFQTSPTPLPETSL